MVHVVKSIEKKVGKEWSRNQENDSTSRLVSKTINVTPGIPVYGILQLYAR